MKTTVEKINPTRTKLTLTVSPEDLKPALKNAYVKIAEQVSVPGFRKGKVPPPIIDQRIGKAAVLEQAVNDGLDSFYREAVQENDVRALGRPQADITQWPSDKDFSGELEITIEVDVRPEIVLPTLDDITLTVDAITVTPDDVEEELDRLRSRFGTLVTADRPAKNGDFAQIDLIAVIDGEEVDTAANISYEIGSGELIEGIDEALDTLTAGESTTFVAPLVGGDHEGENAQITVTLTAVKERELPEADDDFAQIASEFDTIGELRESLRGQVQRAKVFGQGTAARDLLIEKLLDRVEIPVPQQLIEDEVTAHLDQENRTDDDEHRKEVTESSEKTFRTQILLDDFAQNEGVRVSQDELTQYLIQGAAQYGMDPNQFVTILSENGQIPAMVAEVARNKTLAIILGKTTVVDTDGKPVDLGEFVAVATDDADVEAESTSEDAAPSDESPADKPAKKASTAKKTTPRKKKAAEDEE